MKQLYFIAALLIFSHSVRAQEFGDLITFDAYTTSTIITNQYVSHGAIFSGLPAGHYVDIYDYTGLYGPILKSDSWYDQIKLEFVDPSDGMTPVAIGQFGYENPIDSEIDYIVTNFYNEDDELVFTYTSVSPDTIDLNIDDLGATYVVFDDDFSSAYVVDDIWFVADTTEAVVVTEENQSILTTYPNPMVTGCTISFPEVLSNARLEIYDTSAKLVFQENQINGTQYFLQRNQFSAGTYFFRVVQEGAKKYYGNVTVK